MVLSVRQPLRRHLARSPEAYLTAALGEAAVPPALAARLSQRRWDTSPYRRVHRLTWTRLNRPKWPMQGSLAWKPHWGPQAPVAPAGEPEQGPWAEQALLRAERDGLVL
eukprot:TRINITY_DN5340_c0_g1_i1.p1 TRINITY_DN5340_c0_g1~~TRINITY_DN5340_c0_g1_i1.p1  ORF type:complete len:109 (+),score=11.09 TRINITY_DN5340_c0_g1_i1:100-426(+)